jgi:hypothetical protein
MEQISFTNETNPSEKQQQTMGKNGKAHAPVGRIPILSF